MAAKNSANDNTGCAMYSPGESIRKYFPIFSGPRARALSYLDNAASTQKPAAVIERMTEFLSKEYANIHRGAYQLSAEATQQYEQSRNRVARFINAANPDSIVFTRGTTESINLVAYSFGDLLKAGDCVLLSLLEHHSNIVPWQLLAKRKQIRIEFIDVDDSGSLNLEDFRLKLRQFRPKLVSITAISNALGTVVPLKEVIKESQAAGALVLVDAAQMVAHQAIDVQKLKPDFLAFSGHKVYGPTGIGILYAREELLEQMEPFQGGGDMIQTVSLSGSTWAKIPHKFEAGTPAIAEAIALGTALDFIDAVGLNVIAEHEQKLTQHAYELLKTQPGVSIYGPIKNGGQQASIISFNLSHVHPHDLSTVADSFNLQLRAGHHCAMPLLNRLNSGATARISFGVYSCPADLEVLVQALDRAREMFV